MSHNQLINVLWIVLMLVTLGNAWLAESADTNLLVTIIVATVIGFKGRMVVDHFMELKNAHPLIRRSMQIYFYVIPGMIIAVYLFSDVIARWTTLE